MACSFSHENLKNGSRNERDASCSTSLLIADDAEVVVAEQVTNTVKLFETQVFSQPRLH